MLRETPTEITSDSHLPRSKTEKGRYALHLRRFRIHLGRLEERREAAQKIGKLKYNVCFIDGTHENFERLRSYEVSEFKGGKVHHITGNLYHLMRGQTYDFDGVSVFAMGGGESPDIDIRSDLNSWSGDEIPTEAELTEGAQNLKRLGNKVDIIITHEPPMKIKGFLRLKDKEPVRVTGLNTYFEELGAACEYKHWFFGSMHIDKFISSSHIAVFQHIINAETCEIAK